MDEQIKETLLSVTPRPQTSEEIANSILAESDVDAVKSLINQFNLTHSKKNALRVIKYETLLDKVSTEIGERMEKCPDTFTNVDLLKYLQALQIAMEKSNQALNGVENIPIKPVVNQIIIKNETNVFDKESRHRIEGAVASILALANSTKDLEKHIPIDLVEDDVVQVEENGEEIKFNEENQDDKIY